MITRLKLSTVTQGLPKYRSMLAGNDAYIPTNFESIASASGTGSSGTITFSSIPGTYQHLQIRASVDSSATSNATLFLQINSDTGANYARHYFYGDGTSVTASGSTADTSMFCFVLFNSTDYPGAGIIDIHDYASTTKNKTIRSFGGNDINGSGRVYLASALWVNTNAITSITCFLGTGNFPTSSTIALYGIKS